MLYHAPDWSKWIPLDITPMEILTLWDSWYYGNVGETSSVPKVSNIKSFDWGRHVDGDHLEFPQSIGNNWEYRISECWREAHLEAFCRHEFVQYAYGEISFLNMPTYASTRLSLFILGQYWSPAPLALFLLITPRHLELPMSRSPGVANKYLMLHPFATKLWCFVYNI